MPYTEVQKKGNHKYYYRAQSVREGDRVRKIRRYMGADLSKKELSMAKFEMDRLLAGPLSSILSEDESRFLETVKKNHQSQPRENYNNRYESFVSEFTYDSNAIEGSTLSLQETSMILFDKITPKGKSLREINEAVNHKQAFDYMLSYKGDINKRFICKIQEIIAQNTLREDLIRQSGRYRTVQVWIRGAPFTPPKPEIVEKEMNGLIKWYNRNKARLHPVIVAAYFHAGFESIHPFVDGNGRTGRILSNFILHSRGFPMINVPNKEKMRYYDSLNKARAGDLKPLVRVFYGLLMSTKYYI